VGNALPVADTRPVEGDNLLAGADNNPVEGAAGRIPWAAPAGSIHHPAVEESRKAPRPQGRASRHRPAADAEAGERRTGGADRACQTFWLMSLFVKD